MSEKKVGVRKIRSGAVEASSQPSPGTDAIAARAYQLFLERGCEHGRELEDWLAAGKGDFRSALAKRQWHAW